MIRKIITRHFGELHASGEAAISPERFVLLHRKLVGLMALVMIIPLLLMAAINYYEYQTSLSKEIQNPLRVLLNKTKNSFELFLAERASTVSLIASAYTFQDLAEERTLKRIFNVMQREFEGFVDLGLIDEQGVQVSYAGPYSLKGKNYADQSWLQQVMLRGKYVSDVFLGYRKFPHVVIAVKHMSDNGDSWILRATIDTKQFDRILAAMSLEPDSDAFLVNRQGVLQTDSNLYGKVLEKLPIAIPGVSFETAIRPITDNQGRDVYLAYTFFADDDFVLMAVKPRSTTLKTWYTVRGDLLMIFIAGVLGIFLVVYKVTGMMLRRMQESEASREVAFRQMEHSQKLSSIGRLAAGVAHEINNPLAIINEKAGLMKDLVSFKQDFPDQDRFLNLIAAIIRSVERCRGITHRMLGFARRMEVKIEELDVNSIIQETIGFLVNEARYRNVEIVHELDPALPRIQSDQGQLQQVFLNVLNNSLQAVPDGGKILVATQNRDEETIAISVVDNGCGMSEETLKHIFEPFFTTKKKSGTGLGLSITYGIVKRLGGDIDVMSKVNEGTTMTFILPKHVKEGM
jgi:two-component system NtrC family sensor kinase